MMMEPKNYAHYLCALAIERLVELGADHFFIAPGSRSTPIVSAIVRHASAKKFLGIDERSVGFMALGYGKRAQKAGVVVVTSGTAVSNLYPAITEAYLSSTPLLVITADRPFELRDCGANQTIFQSNMFANHVVKSYDLAPPTPVVSRDATLAIFEQAWRATNGLKRGPVHLNVQLREPLANLTHEMEPAWSQEQLPKRKLSSSSGLSLSPSDELQKKFQGQGLIIVGELLPERGQDKILALAQRLGWPIFADIASNLRLHSHERVVAHYDLKLLNPDFLASLSACSTVVKFGSRVVSKRLWQWLEKQPSSSLLISIDETPDRIDQTGRFEHVLVGDLPTFLARLIDACPPCGFANALPGHNVENAIAGLLENAHLNEAYIAARLVAKLTESTNLFLSSGMPIRDVDQFARPTSHAIDVFVNRGASGIDGIVSTASGIAVADSKPTVVLMGDVAFLHDTNGLMQLKHSSSTLVIVINNGGGGIFHFLPIAQEPDVITPYLDSPHEIQLDLLCGAHDVPHILVTTPKDLDDALREFFRVRKTCVVEVRVDRAQNVQAHRVFYESISTLAKA